MKSSNDMHFHASIRNMIARVASYADGETPRVLAANALTMMGHRVIEAHQENRLFIERGLISIREDQPRRCKAETYMHAFAHCVMEHDLVSLNGGESCMLGETTGPILLREYEYQATVFIAILLRYYMEERGWRALTVNVADNYFICESRLQIFQQPACHVVAPSDCPVRDGCHLVRGSAFLDPMLDNP